MKTRSIIFLVVAVSSFMCASVPAKAQSGYGMGMAVRDVSDFYQPLTPFGSWVQLPSYGWCWYPANVDADWRPYANGHWLWSDGGWYWASEEPWAWACYHYGRWLQDSYYGWVWVPGLEWAPAWVGWRDGDDYVGWAPLPPPCDFGPDREVIYAPQVVIAPQTFVFVERHHFCDLIRPSVLIVNQTIVNKTVNITKIVHVNNTVVNYGPNPQVIQQSNPGRVQGWKVKPEHRPPADVPATRRWQQDRPAPEVIHGSRGQADRKVIVQPVPIQFDSAPAPNQRVESPRPQPVTRDRVAFDGSSSGRDFRSRPVEERPVAARPAPQPAVNVQSQRPNREAIVPAQTDSGKGKTFVAQRRGDGF